MSPRFSCSGLVLALVLTATGNAAAQGSSPPASNERPAKPSGPAAKKASDLIARYTARIEKEIELYRKEVARLRAELRELVDLRYAITDAIAELRGELAAKGTYHAENADKAPAVYGSPGRGPFPQLTETVRRDFVHGLGSSLPKEPTAEQREQLRRLAPRTELKRMIERLRAEVDETRADVDELAYELLELSQGLPGTLHGFGNSPGPWFGSMGAMGGMM